MINPVAQNLAQTYQSPKKAETQKNTPTNPLLSEEGSRRATLAEKVREFRENQEVNREKMRRLTEDAENARAAAKEQAEHWRNQRIAMEIAARIMRGDNVPQEDKDFLLEHSPGMFKLDMSVRQRNENPEDYDQLSPRERQNEPLYGFDIKSNSSSPDGGSNLGATTQTMTPVS